MRKLITLSLLCFSCGVDSTMSQGEGGNEAHAGPVASTGQAVTGSVCPGGATVRGIDVSVYQGGSVNWGAVKAAGYEFGIARVSDGLGYTDGTFAGNWSRMKSAGMIRGAYQYFEPGEDPTAQANLVISKVGHLGAGDLPVMLDVETTGGQSPGTITARIHAWVNAIAAGTGKKPFIYTGAYFWDASVQSADFASLPLNVAWYGTNCPGEPSAWSGHAWTFHQFTDAQSVPGVPGGVDADVFNGSLAQLQALAGDNAPAPSCHRTAGGFTWSCNGPIAGESCVQINEPADPDTWNDNYLCSKVNLDIKWSHAGTIAGMRCTQVDEPSDPHTWNDNYLCVPEVSPYNFRWSHAGPVAGDTCIQFDEPADPDTWNDNFLCFNDGQQAKQARGPFEWSSNGPVPGKACTHVDEPADPDTWNDNYFCSDTNLEMRWSHSGTLPNMVCTQIHEGSDPHTWNDNYLCLPHGSPYTFRWSSAGPLNTQDRCIAWYEAADPDTWNDNYLCW
jgi:GH25 family lysozyme M1 (1,4-beta-N-acetylmuramidase)